MKAKKWHVFLEAFGFLYDINNDNWYCRKFVNSNFNDAAADQNHQG